MFSANLLIAKVERHACAIAIPAGELLGGAGGGFFIYRLFISFVFLLKLQEPFGHRRLYLYQLPCSRMRERQAAGMQPDAAFKFC